MTPIDPRIDPAALLDPTILSVPTSRLVSREEERFCVGLGELVRQVSCSLFDAGILVEPEAR